MADMNEDELFERLPDLVFAGIRLQLLLGALPAVDAASVLEPLLEDFWNIIWKLPPDLQADLENILRIYPDLAAKWGLRMKPPIQKSLTSLAEFLLLPRHPANIPVKSAVGAEIFDLAAQHQAKFEAGERRVLFEGQGFFQTDTGNGIFLEFSYFVGDDFITFARRSAESAIQVQIKGSIAIEFGRGEAEKKSGIGEFLKICWKGGFEKADIKVIDRT